MKQSSIAPTTARGFTKILWIGVAAAWTVYGLYIYKFAPGNWFNLSSKPEDWGVFGDYVGGLLNPFFSFLAFTGVIITVILQARQLDIVREQANHEELQRLLASVSSNLDSLLRARPPLYRAKKVAGIDETPMTVFNHISAFGTRILNPSLQSENWDQDVFDAIEDDLKMTFHTIGVDLQGLAMVMDKFRAAGGSADILEFYNYRYLAVTCWLDAMGYLKSHNLVQKVFEPNRFSEIFTQSA